MGSCARYGIGLPIDLDRAFECYKQLAYRGDAEGQMLFGDYLMVCHWAFRDASLAVHYMELAANQGIVSAAYTLATWSSPDNNTSGLSLTRMVELYQQAADHGHRKAQFCLGDCFEKGIGCERDLVQSANYYRMAMEQGCDEARTAYERCMKLLKKK
jgi:TPR repeat protein